MPTLSDARFDALRDQGFTGATSDMLQAWLLANGATSPSIPDAWYEMLVSLGYSGSRSDMWYEYLGDQGYEGNISDRELGFWSDGGVIGGGYTFNGVDQYATHASWDTLGDSSVYPPTFSFATDNPDGNIVDPTLPVTEFGRVGGSYHTGSLSNLRYIDNSPLNGKTVITGPMSTPDIDLRNARITVDVAYVSGAQTLLGPAILTAGGDDILVLGANVDAVLVDGIAYAGQALSGHFRLSVDVSTGIFNQLGELSSFGNTLSITNDSY